MAGRPTCTRAAGAINVSIKASPPGAPRASVLICHSSAPGRAQGRRSQSTWAPACGLNDGGASLGDPGGVGNGASSEGNSGWEQKGMLPSGPGVFDASGPRIIPHAVGERNCRARDAAASLSVGAVREAALGPRASAGSASCRAKFGLAIVTLRASRISAMDFSSPRGLSLATSVTSGWPSATPRVSVPRITALAGLASGANSSRSASASVSACASAFSARDAPNSSNCFVSSSSSLHSSSTGSSTAHGWADAAGGGWQAAALFQPADGGGGQYSE